jgi:hypothetical protein
VAHLGAASRRVQQVDLWVINRHAAVSHNPSHIADVPPDLPARVSALPPNTTAWHRVWVPNWSSPRSRTYCPADRSDGWPARPTPSWQSRRWCERRLPGKIARHLLDHNDLGEAERHALRQGHTARPGQGYRPHVTAALHVHYALLAAAAPLGADGAASAARTAYRYLCRPTHRPAILTDPVR